jgi:hypothetical protein
VVLPPIFEPLYREAAIYADPEEALLRVDQLMEDDNAYEAQVARAIAFVETRFGPSQHERRLKKY